LWQNLYVSYYPRQINDHFNAPVYGGDLIDANVIAVGASFACGSYVSLALRIDDDMPLIASSRFQTNGCGFMIAAANVLCRWLEGRSLTDLHGLTESELMDVVTGKLGDLPAPRVQCAEIVFETLRKAMATHRANRIQEFLGEKALICTCFGVSEETVIGIISKHPATSVEDISEACRAGSGCGSCQMLIAELIDAHSDNVA
jgi:NifU-like protein